MGRAYSTNGRRMRRKKKKKRTGYRILVGKPEGKRPPGRRIHRWEDNIRYIYGKWDGMVWYGMVWYGMVWSGLVWPVDQRRVLMNSVMNLRVP
jgi:hypothetical protein